MREQQDATKRTQNPPPPSLERKYIRRLLEAFEPHQDGMLADLDRQIEESDPAIVSRKSEKLSKQWRDTMKQLEQAGRTESGIEEATLIALLKEIEAIDETQKTLREQLRSTTRQNTILKYKRAHLVELLQTIHTIRQEVNWENIWEKEKYNAEFVLLGERFLMFSSVKQELRLQTIEDIDEWMKHQQIDFAPAMEEQASTTEKTAKPTPRKHLAAKKQPTPSASHAQIYESQAWIRLLVSARHYSSHFQDHLGELGVFVYDEVESKPRAILHLWANGAKQQFPVVNGTISQQEALTDTMRAWLAMCWVAATGEAGEDKLSNTASKTRRDQTDER